MGAADQAASVSGDQQDHLRRTKVVATLGPASDDGLELERMIRAGLDVARVNFSHGRAEEHRARVAAVRAQAEAVGRHVGVMVDLQGPKIRIEGFRDGPVQLSEGDRFTLDPQLAAKAGDATRVGVSLKTLSEDLKVGDVILLDDGNIVMEVEQMRGNAVCCRVLVGGALSDNKGLNRQGGGLSAPALTEKDINDIRLAAELQADYVAVSFVRDGSDIDRAREILEAAGGHALIVAKIERAEAIENVDAIIDTTDVVMIARGDLGVEMGDAELPAMQKRIINQGRLGNRVVITATQMMQSMIESPQPTRAEVLDVANAVMDGTDAVMLSAETAIGRHPHKVIAAMDRICRGAERQRITMVSNHRLDALFNSNEEAIAMAAMYTANHLDVRALVAMTESGTTAKWMSRISSGLPIFALSSRLSTLRRVTMYRGVYPIRFQNTQGAGVAQAEQEILRELRRLGVIKKDDSVIVTKGDLTGVPGATNTMKILKV